jgi:large subunit ribosomal protein L18
MIHKEEKKEIRSRVHKRIRRKLAGTAERPRLAVFRSSRHIYVQVIDDLQNKTLVGTSDLGLEAGDDEDKKAMAKKVGTAIAKKCLEKGIDKVVFDRAGFKYHGRVSALADGAREAGLKF